MRKPPAFLAAALAALLLAACGGGAHTPPAATAPPSAPSVPPVSSALPPEEPGPQTPPESPALPAMPLDGLDNAEQHWWFGRERDEENRPAQCVLMQEQYGGLGLVALGPDAAAVYLTFDFGYESGYSGDILDTLAAKDAPGTFFVVEGYARQNPDTIRRMLDEGHAVGNHSATHPGEAGRSIPIQTEADAQNELDAVRDLLRQEYGYECYQFRFPAGIYSEKTLAMAANSGQYSVFWSFAYEDWNPDNQPDEAESLQKALAAAHPGAVYLLHPMQTNAAILGRLIDGLRALGYEPALLPAPAQP